LTVEVLTATASDAVQRRVAGALVKRGLVPGDRIAMGTSSGSNMISAILGALRVGIVPVVLNAGLLDAERDELLADAGPALMVDDATLAELAGGEPVDLAPHPLARPMHYTSGTTGRSKGVWSGLLDEAAAAALFVEEVEQWQFASDDVHLVCSPFHHSVAIRFSAGTLLSGGTIVILGRFDATQALLAIEEHRPTTSFMVPAHLQRVFSEGGALDTSSFRQVVHAGAPCPEPIKLEAIEAFGVERVWEFYGSTEGQFTACRADAWLDRRGTVGRARRHREITVDADDVIWCAVPQYARWEYWRDADKTAAAWRADAFTVGDLGRLDDDGYLYLEGRRDDLIITGGVNVYPAEIERVLASAPGVESVAVFGVEDERWGQRVCAAIVGDAQPDEALAFARTQLAGYKCPKDVYQLDELPHTSTGKVQRMRVPEMLGLTPPAGAAEGRDRDSPPG
jgi:long-chain acyl-CoA synthetase